MDPKLEAKFYETFDYMFRNRKLSMQETCMCWGLDVGNGWYGLLWDLCTGIQRVLDENPKLKETFSVEQVKEKFGTLRFYVNGSNDEIDQFINTAEQRSAQTCEICGEKGTLTGKGWVTTLCPSCKTKRGKGEI